MAKLIKQDKSPIARVSENFNNFVVKLPIPQLFNSLSNKKYMHRMHALNILIIENINLNYTKIYLIEIWSNLRNSLVTCVMFLINKHGGLKFANPISRYRSLNSPPPNFGKFLDPHPANVLMLWCFCFIKNPKDKVNTCKDRNRSCTWLQTYLSFLIHKMIPSRGISTHPTIFVTFTN